MLSFASLAETPDVIIVGAGIGGLSAAAEAGRKGTRVTVVDMFSVFGGHAIMSSGGLSIVDSPLQRERGIQDSPELAERDFLKWGEDANPEWVRLYAQSSKVELYDWLTGMGFRFHGVGGAPGNSVPRFHSNREFGVGLVSTIYRECLRYPNIEFLWNTEVTGLAVEQGRVTGVIAKDHRTGESNRLSAKAVILATGGYQSNRKLLEKHWPKGLPFPNPLLLGGGLHATGSGLALAESAGGSVSRLDHQWNYPWGLEDPRFPGSGRGLTVRNFNGIWVNSRGQRFVNELLNARDALAAVVRQDPPIYWLVFDEKGRRSLSVAGSDWANRSKIDQILFDDPNVVKTASSLDELARITGLPATVFKGTVDRYNGMVAGGSDVDFQRIGPRAPQSSLIMVAKPVAAPIEAPPYYALRMSAVTRKSMGGVAIDTACRVLDAVGDPIAGLFAVGEVAGFGGLNGRAGLEGTFLGPAILQGRIAGRSLAVERKPPQVGTDDGGHYTTAAPTQGNQSKDCNSCHDMKELLSQDRPGYYHFQKVHRKLEGRKIDCVGCHAEMSPFQAAKHHIDREAQVNICAACHLSGLD
jgi:flavocytochrome c